jgi:hypothetical protein
MYFEKKNVTPNWKNEIQTNGFSYTIDDVIAYANEHHLENLIALITLQALILLRITFR